MTTNDDKNNIKDSEGNDSDYSSENDNDRDHSRRVAHPELEGS